MLKSKKQSHRPISYPKMDTPTEKPGILLAVKKLTETTLYKNNIYYLFFSSLSAAIKVAVAPNNTITPATTLCNPTLEPTITVFPACSNASTCCCLPSGAIRAKQVNKAPSPNKN